MSKKHKKTAIVLGGTNPHIELIKQLQLRGYYTILLDYLDNPVAKPYADLHIQESTMDPEGVLEAAKQYHADVVITACVDQANITACYVAEKLGLTKPYSYETAKRITNKAEMKKAMIEHGIPTTKYIYIDHDQNVNMFKLTYPVMVKPADSYGTSGVKKANSIRELEEHLAFAKKVSRSGRAVVEEFFQGIEISAYIIVKNRRAHIIMISERLSVTEGEGQVIKCYATVTPPLISDVAKKKIEEAANGIVEAFDLDNTPLHVQALVQGDEIDIIEFAARVAGGISYQTIKQNTGMDMITAAIDSYLEKEIILTNHSPLKYYAVNLIYGQNGIYNHIEGMDNLLNHGIVDDIHYYRNKGSKITQDRANDCRIAAFITSGDSREELHDKAVKSFKSLTVVGEDGRDLTRRDLILR